MNRTLTAAALLLSLTSGAALADDAPTDATTPMDRMLGNQPEPGTKTLSNSEVRQLRQDDETINGTGPATPARDPAAGDTAPAGQPLPLTNGGDTGNR